MRLTTFGKTLLRLGKDRDSVDHQHPVSKYRRSEMEKQERTIPFGLLFEEAVPLPQGLIMPTYDEETDLSYVEDLQGYRVPYVEFSVATGTQTETKVWRETTDTDPGDDRTGFSATGTTTFTEVRVESTDTDPEDDNARFVSSVGTDTLTLVQAEPTDTDPGDDHSYCGIRRSLLGTDTITAVERDPTDQD
jgi:hypothetical protein